MSTPRNIAIIAAIAALPLSACTTNPETGNKRISKAAIGGLGGALGGYLLGDLVGGRRDRTEKILGAGIGAVALARALAIIWMSKRKSSASRPPDRA